MAASGGIDARRPRDAQPLRLSARRHQVPRQAEYSRARSTRFQPREKKKDRRSNMPCSVQQRVFFHERWVKQLDSGSWNVLGSESNRVWLFCLSFREAAGPVGSRHARWVLQRTRSSSPTSSAGAARLRRVNYIDIPFEDSGSIVFSQRCTKK